MLLAQRPNCSVRQDEELNEQQLFLQRVRPIRDQWKLTKMTYLLQLGVRLSQYLLQGYWPLNPVLL